MTIQELKDLVLQKIAGQGSQIDIGGALPPVLNGILDTLAATQSITQVNVTVDEGTGTPSAEASVADGVLTLNFHNLKGEKGEQGNTGSSVDYPFELVNNLTSDDATKALCAAEGVVLDGKISQLGQEVADLEAEEGALRRESTEFVIAYPVTAGGSNGRDFFVNLPKGEYVFTIDENGTGNTGTFNLYFTPSSAITGTGSDCRIGIGRGVVINSSITKVSVGDINSSITSTGEMLLKIRQLRSVLQRIENRNNVEDNFSNLLHGPFVNAGVISGALSSYKAQYRASSVDILRYSRDLLIKANSGYKFGILLYSDSGTYISDSGWKTSYSVPANTNFRISVSTMNDNTVLSPETGRANVLISTLLDEKIATSENSISVTGQGATGVQTTVQFVSKKVKFKIATPWPITNVGAGGNNVISVGYVKGGVQCDLQALTKTEMDAYFEKEFLVVFPEFSYDSTYIFIRADSGASAKVEW